MNERAQVIKLVADPDIPIEDRMLLACFYHLFVEDQKNGDTARKIRSRKALVSAIATVERLAVPA